MDYDNGDMSTHTQAAFEKIGKCHALFQFRDRGSQMPKALFLSSRRERERKENTCPRGKENKEGLPNGKALAESPFEGKRFIPVGKDEVLGSVAAIMPMELQPAAQI